jgi:hypothetical protein
MKSYQYILLFIMAATLQLSSCKKDDDITIPEEFATFTNLTADRYEITGPSVTYKVPIGLTTIAAVDRTVTISITSPTGAVEGTHYTVSTKTVTIPAGKVLDSITVQGNYAQYLAGRKDTLIFTIVDPGTKPSDYNSTFTLLVRGPCFASDLDVTTVGDLAGTYADTRETTSSGGSPYGPYTSKVKSIQVLSPTTAKVKFENIYDDGWSDIEATLDWTNTSAPVVTIIRQPTGTDYATGMPMDVRTNPTTPSTFNFCTQTFNLSLDIIVNNYPTPGSAAFLAQNYKVNIKR